jgi:hypothetical protein
MATPSIQPVQLLTECPGGGSVPGFLRNQAGAPALSGGDEASSQEVHVRQKKKPVPRKPANETGVALPAAAMSGARRRPNVWQPQVIVPQQVDLPSARPGLDEIVVPAGVNGRSLVNGRL